MGLKFKMKDIGNELFTSNNAPYNFGNTSLNWLHYMQDADLLYPGPKVKKLFSKEDIASEYDVLYEDDVFYIVMLRATEKKYIICRTQVKPEGYKTNSFAVIEREIREYTISDNEDLIKTIAGVSNFRRRTNGISFTASGKLNISENSLVMLGPDSPIADEKLRRLMIHAFLVKDIFIPVTADVIVNWEERAYRSVRISYTTGYNPHLNIGCFGSSQGDVDYAVESKDALRAAILISTAIGNINLADVCLWRNKSLFDSHYSYRTIIVDGSTVELTEDNFNTYVPKVNVDFNVVNSIISRHSIE